MRFDWPPETRERIAAARRFAEATLRSRRREPGLDRAAWRAAAEFGLFGQAMCALPGGARSASALDSAACFEALGRGGGDRGLLFAMAAHLFGCVAPFATYATDAQAAAWEAKLRDGRAVGALAVTEPDGGSTLERMRSEAVPVAGGYRISGEKTLVANATAADLFIVLARKSGVAGALGLGAFIVPAASNGVFVAPLAASGLPGAALGTVTFDGCFVPDAAVLGRVGAGLRVFATAMQWERSCLLAGFLGAAERDLAACRAWLAERQDGGGPLLRHQALSHRLARAALALDSARLVLYRAAWLIDQGQTDRAAAAMAKLAASEAVAAAAEDVVRLTAGAGWRGAAGEPAAALSDALGALFASGSNEMMLELLARHLPEGDAR